MKNGPATENLTALTMDGIYTVANDRMAQFLETFLVSVRRAMPTIPVCIIPFDDSLERTKELAKLHNATLMEPSAVWDEIGLNIYGQQEYRPGIPAYRYFRKFNSFDGPFDKFCFMDANSILLQPLGDSFAGYLDSYDFIFAKHSGPNRTIKSEAAQQVLQLLSPKLRSGFNAGFFLSRKGVIDPGNARVLGSNPRLRRFFGKAPEQAFLAWYIAVCGVRHAMMGEIDTTAQTGFWGTRFSVEKRDDGCYYFTEGPSVGRRVYFLKWTGQDASAVQDAKNAELFNLFRQ
jgi:hypothetical protein